ncbi:hypothetical protein [Mycolicibacterium fortuitum]|uniref:hypothetical protein n=1 Tax=Mycolicibacterium fortuitum TaxID=1766 RepID=UPI001AEFAE94|nr:hypothetical protein [Mycolicibacterium fortuitum]MBP3085484.1 hypothetical protein [Mycolicibacterium fortuitum]
MSMQPPGWSGQPLPAPHPFPGYPPRKAPPKKRWYGVGAALLLVGLAVVGFGVFGLATVFDVAPDAEHSFANGEMKTVHFDAGETKVIFVADRGEHDTGQCSISTPTGSDDDIKMDNYEGSLTINQWQALFTVTAQTASDYAITCDGASSGQFGVGGDAKATPLVGGIFAIIGGGFLCVLGIVTLVVIGLLRWRRKA